MTTPPRDDGTWDPPVTPVRFLLAAAGAAYLVSAAAQIGLAALLRAAPLDPLYGVVVDVLPPRPPVAGVFSSYGVWDPVNTAPALVLRALVMAAVLALLHVACLGIAGPLLGRLARPPHWAVVRADRARGRRAAAGALAVSAWRAAWVLPVATAVWVGWEGLSQHTIFVNPTVLLPEAPARGLNLAAVAWAWACLTVAGLAGSARRAFAGLGPRCGACGYPLRAGGSRRCPECGRETPPGPPPRARLPRPLAPLGPGRAAALLRWTIFALLLAAPIIVPGAMGALRALLAR